MLFPAKYNPCTEETDELMMRNVKLVIEPLSCSKVVSEKTTVVLTNVNDRVSVIGVLATSNPSENEFAMQFKYETETLTSFTFAITLLPAPVSVA